MLSRGCLVSRNSHLLRQVITKTAAAAAATSLTGTGHWILTSRGLSTACLRPSRSQRVGKNLAVATAYHVESSFLMARPSMVYVSRRYLIIAPDASPVSTEAESDTEKSKERKLHIPTNLRQKVISATDAVSLVRSGDTISVSGFVCQGAPEAVLKALGERYEATGAPNNLTLLFGGGPGDWDTRGLNHLAKIKEDESSPPMLRRTIGAHYGQVPQVEKLALDEITEAWTIPLGSVSRMIRSQATHSPGHITSVGIGTYVDPALSGGAANQKAAKSDFHSKLISRITIDGKDELLYRALPIHVAIIRGTTGDAQGNITMEDESLLCDQKILAAAARNSGGIVIAQVKRLAANNSLSAREVAVPGPLVDCVVVVDEEDHDTLHSMSYVERNNPVLTGKIKTPQDEIPVMPLSPRKVIARRAFMGLKPNTVVNLGIGLPEGVAAVAFEEGMSEFVTLSTEPGVFGGLPASGKSFGPSSNFSALIEMNQMFDFYDGGGLDKCFLGAGQVNQFGDVNVSRLTKSKIVGPGGFIDISQSTPRITFMTPFTAKGLEVSIPGDGTIKVEKEGTLKKFVNEVLEKTFSGDEAVRRGQTVYYVTERAVFRRTGRYPTLELVEIAPGIDLQKDVLDQMAFDPIVSPELKRMDPRIYINAKMNVRSELFGALEDRCTYHPDNHTMYLDMFGIMINSEDDIRWLAEGVAKILQPLVDAKGPVAMVVNYDGFDLRKGLEDKYTACISELQQKYYKSAKRFHGQAFRRAQLGSKMVISDIDYADLYDQFDLNKDGQLSVEEIRAGMEHMFHIKLTGAEIEKFHKEAQAGVGENEPIALDRAAFAKVVKDILAN